MAWEGEPDPQEESPLGPSPEDLPRPAPPRSYHSRRSCTPRVCLSGSSPDPASLRRCVETRRGLVVFSAPAGAGKTSVIREWLEKDGRPWAWLHLDHGDNDPVVLLEYLARALLRVSPLDPQVLGWLELPEPPVRRVILPALVDAASAAPAFVLVLDDAHAVRDHRCWQILAALSEAVAAESSLVISSRSDPPLHFSRLRSQGALAEYRLPGSGLRPRRDAGRAGAARHPGHRRRVAGRGARCDRGVGRRSVPHRPVVPRPAADESARPVRRSTGDRGVPDRRGPERPAARHDRVPHPNGSRGPSLFPSLRRAGRTPRQRRRPGGHAPRQSLPAPAGRPS